VGSFLDANTVPSANPGRAQSQALERENDGKKLGWIVGLIGNDWESSILRVLSVNKKTF
jgi:hypothetical protein